MDDDNLGSNQSNTQSSSDTLATPPRDANESKDEGSEHAESKGKIAEFVSLGWKGLLFFGGVFLLIFFIQNGFFPDLKLSDLTATLAAVSMIGLLMLVVFGGSFVITAVMAHGAITRLSAAKGAMIFSALAGASLAWTLCLHLLFNSTTLLIGGIVLALLLVAGAYWRDSKRRAITSDACTSGTEKTNETSPKWSLDTLRRWRHRAWTLVQRYIPVSIEIFVVAFAFFVGQLVATYYFGISYQVPDDSNQAWIGYTWPIVCFFANIILLSADGTDEKGWWKNLALTAGLLLLMFLSTTSAVSLMSGGIARRLAIGQIENANVTLSKEGCEIAEASSGGILKCVRDGTEMSGVVCPVTIVSRIGSEVVLRPANASFEVILKSEQVLGWARGVPIQAARDAGKTPKGKAHQQLLSLRCDHASDDAKK